jgi:hypothetical protein
VNDKSLNNYRSILTVKYRIPTPSNDSSPDSPATKSPSCETDTNERPMPIAIAEMINKIRNRVVIRLPSSKRKCEVLE